MDDDNVIDMVHTMFQARMHRDANKAKKKPGSAMLRAARREMLRLHALSWEDLQAQIERLGSIPRNARTGEEDEWYSSLLIEKARRDLPADVWCAAVASGLCGIVWSVPASGLLEGDAQPTAERPNLASFLGG